MHECVFLTASFGTTGKPALLNDCHYEDVWKTDGRVESIDGILSANPREWLMLFRMAIRAMKMVRLWINRCIVEVSLPI